MSSNSIYQHSGETVKDTAVAQQAAVNEDQEQRRRQLDSLGEAIKMASGKQVSSLIDDMGAVHLNHVTYEPHKEPLLQQAQNVATTAATTAVNAATSAATTAVNAATSAATTAANVASNATSTAVNAATNVAATAANTATSVLQSAIATGKNIINSATATAEAAAEKVSDVTHMAAATASHIGKDAAVYAAQTAKNASNYVQHAAHEAAHQAADIASQVKAQTVHATEAISQKTKELADNATNKAMEIADNATNKAHEIADNISHFTTLVGVLAQEESERARRLVSGDEALAAANAFRVSALIRDLGADFYKQETPNLNYATKILEEAERRYRINSTSSILAESNAHLVGKLVNKNMQNFMPRYQWARQHIGAIEETERTRRITDADESYAIMNALNTSNLIHDLDRSFYRQSGVNAGYATTLLEENERRIRIREDKLHHAEDSAHLLMDVVANNMEKFNYTTRHAARFATEFANLISRETLKVASSFAAITKDLAKNTAQRVRDAASDLSHFSNVMYVVALEERERARRLSDSDEFTAILNAWRQSQLIRDLSSLYRGSSVARFPISLIEEGERRWRLSSVTPASSRKLSELVLANIAKFESHTHLKSRLNVNAPAFVPHQPTLSKPEPAPVQRSTLASGAQL